MRPVIAVAAGCLVNTAGEVLIAQRPQGKIAAGQWEFPGGKIEPGERADEALVRELEEELDVLVRASRPLIRVRHDYADRTVVLDTWLVTAYDGTPRGRENQAFVWAQPARLVNYPLLAADKPIVAALQLPSDYVFTPPNLDEPTLMAQLPALPSGSLLRLRRPQLDDSNYAVLAARLAPRCRELGLRLMLDRAPELAVTLGAAGWHGRSPQLAGLQSRPVPESMWFAASVHGEHEMQLARAAGADFMVLGSIRQTSSHAGGAVLDWSRFSELVAQASVPVYGIGGVGPADRDQLIAVYAQGAAGISAYWSVLPSS